MNVAYNVDCMEYMKSLPDKHFELAIVDPPYGININMNMGRKKGEQKKHAEKTWDNSAPSIEYFNELRRVSNNQIIWGGNYFQLPVTAAWVYWHKEVPEGVSFASGELAWTSYGGTLREANVPYSGFVGCEGKIHPTQKPVKLYEWLLTHYAKQGEKILDTHLGSGSSRIAAYNLGFDFVGCEIDADYFKAQEERFAKHTAQQSLFVFDDHQEMIQEALL